MCSQTIVYLTLFISSHVLLHVAGKLPKDCKDQTCLMEDLDPSSGSKLLQVDRSNVQHKSSSVSCINSALGRTIPLDDDGYEDVAESCCYDDMKDFIRRLATEMELNVCSEGGLSGFAPFFSCQNTTSLADLKGYIRGQAAPKTHCQWLAEVGKKCPEKDPSCGVSTNPDKEESLFKGYMGLDAENNPPALVTNDKVKDALKKVVAGKLGVPVDQVEIVIGTGPVDSVSLYQVVMKSPKTGRYVEAGPDGSLVARSTSLKALDAKHLQGNSFLVSGGKDIMPKGVLVKLDKDTLSFQNEAGDDLLEDEHGHVTFRNDPYTHPAGLDAENNPPAYVTNEFGYFIGEEQVKDALEQVVADKLGVPVGQVEIVIGTGPDDSVKLYRVMMKTPKTGKYVETEPDRSLIARSTKFTTLQAKHWQGNSFHDSGGKDTMPKEVLVKWNKDTLSFQNEAGDDLLEDEHGGLTFGRDPERRLQVDFPGYNSYTSAATSDMHTRSFIASAATSDTHSGSFLASRRACTVVVSYEVLQTDPPSLDADLVKDTAEHLNVTEFQTNISNTIAKVEPCVGRLKLSTFKLCKSKGVCEDKSLKPAHTDRDYNHQGNHVPEEDVKPSSTIELDSAVELSPIKRAVSWFTGSTE